MQRKSTIFVSIMLKVVLRRFKIVENEKYSVPPKNCTLLQYSTKRTFSVLRHGYAYVIELHIPFLWSSCG